MSTQPPFLGGLFVTKLNRSSVDHSSCHSHSSEKFVQMAISTLPLIVVAFLLAGTASARPCKTLFYFSATTTATYYPRNFLPRNPNPNPNYILQARDPRYLTLIFSSTTTSTRFPDLRPSINFNSDGAFEQDPQSSSIKASADFPVRPYSSVSSSIRDRTRDVMSVVGALLFGVGCGALASAVMYFLWALFSPSRFDFEDVSSSSSDDDGDDDMAAAKKKLGYLAIPSKVFDNGDLKKPALPAKEVV